MTRWFYAVGRGRQTGVYSTWADCYEQVKNITNGRYRKFASEAEAWQFVEECKQSLSPYKSTPSTHVSPQCGGTIPLPPSTLHRSLSPPVSRSEGCSSSAVSNSNSVAHVSSQHEGAIPLSPSAVRRVLLSPSSSSSSVPNNDAVPDTISLFKNLIGDAEAKIKELAALVNTFSSGTSGKRCCPLCGSVKKDDDIEEIPLPPKKIPKIEVESDDDNEEVQKHSFDCDENGYVIVYTDGACENNGRKNARAGVGVWFKDNHPLNFSEPVMGRATNNNAEIQAAVHAVEIVKKAGFKKVIINTDSEFMINCMTKWIMKWRMNGWSTATGKPVKNRSELVLLDEAMKGMDIRWNHVRGHTGVYGNEMADYLARKGAERYISIPY